MQLKDLDTVEKRLEKVNRAAKTGNKEAQTEKALLDRIRDTLLQAKSARTITPQNNDEEVVDGRFSIDYCKTSFVCL